MPPGVPTRHSIPVPALCIACLLAVLGPRDVRTTMVYAHVLNRGGLGVRSPLDG
jgi:hypothetical protein